MNKSLDNAINTLSKLFFDKYLKVEIYKDNIGLYLKGGKSYYSDYHGNLTYTPRNSYKLASHVRTDPVLDKIAMCTSRAEVLEILDWSEFESLLNAKQSDRYLDDKAKAKAQNSTK